VAGAYRYASLGIAFAAGILIFLAAGRRVMGDAAKDKAAQRPKDRLP
jgi:hypothetical protein